MKQKEHWLLLKPVFVRLKLHAIRVEDARAVGVPDVNFAHGWLELKQVAAGHYTREGTSWGLTENQCRWIYMRTAANGRVFVSLAVGEELYLLRGIDIARDVLDGRSCLAKVHSQALANGIKQYGARLAEYKKLWLDITPPK